MGVSQAKLFSHEGLLWAITARTEQGAQDRCISVKRAFLITAGVVSLVLGLVGIVVPLLPTTPFLLLAATCFLRSSPKLYRWLTTHPVFGSYILGYQRFKAVSIKAKVSALALLWTCILYSVLVVVSVLWVKVILLFIAAGVSVHILTLKNLTKEMKVTLSRERAPDSSESQWRQKTVARQKAVGKEGFRET